MRLFSFEFRDDTVVVSYSLSEEWLATWSATRMHDGRPAQRVNGATQSKIDDDHLEYRLMRAVCQRISAMQSD